MVRWFTPYYRQKNHDRREDGKAYLIAKYGKISTPVKIATMKERNSTLT